jgi:5-methylcytosine-specific restriction endonuclease McrA
MVNHNVLQCKKCGKKLSKKSINRKDRKVSGLCRKCYQGKNNYGWKGGLPRCIDCNKKLTNYRKGGRCKKCFHRFYRGKNTYQWISNKFKPECKKCGKLLINKYAKYCGQHRNTDRKRKLRLKCIDCGEELHRDAGRKKSKFCKVCVFKGSRSSNWRGGITPKNLKIRNSLKYKLWRDKCFKRDKYTCQNCGWRGKGLQVDHIRPFSKFPKSRFIIKNGRTLCKYCHNKIGWKNRKEK